MSSATPHPLKCPNCGHEQETTVWESINTSVSPELKESLLKAEINMFICANCQNKAFIAAPLLYHDMDAKYCVQYYPPQALDDVNFYEQFSDRGYLADGIGLPNIKGVAYLYRPHIVFDMDEMLRYIKFRDRLGNLAGFIHDPTQPDDDDIADHPGTSPNPEDSSTSTPASPAGNTPQ